MQSNMFRRLQKNSQQDEGKPVETAVLNIGLSLAMEWGENWLEPIQARLSEKFPVLTAAELDTFNTICHSAMKYGHDSLYIMAEKGEHPETNKEQWTAVVLSRYPWINQDNLGRLYSQGMYYAWKDSLIS